jgi:hypothetical protein
MGGCWGLWPFAQEGMFKFSKLCLHTTKTPEDFFGLLISVFPVLVLGGGGFSSFGGPFPLGKRHMPWRLFPFLERAPKMAGKEKGQRWGFSFMGEWIPALEY